MHREAEASPDTHSGAVASPEPAASPTGNPWRGIAAKAIGVSLGAGVILAVIAAVLGGTPGLVSCLAAVVVVVAFFAISLLVASVVADRAPKAVVASFLITYVIKVIGFGAFLLIPHDPAWFSKLWMSVGAVVAVIVWQVVEVFLFSRLRLQIFDEEAAA